MQRLVTTPGVAPDTLYIAEPASWSPSVTVPEANVLPLLLVVLDSAEKVAAANRLATAATRQVRRRIFFERVMTERGPSRASSADRPIYPISAGRSADIALDIWTRSRPDSFAS